MRWLLTTWGSYGDLHPFLAFGRGLIARGHEVSFVGHPDWQTEIERSGLRFLSSGERPYGDFIEQHPELLSSKWNGMTSMHTLIHQLVAPALPAMCEAIRAAAVDHDVIVAHHFVLGAPIAAQLTGKPWATVSLAPGVVPSAYSTPGGDYTPVRDGAFWRLRNSLLWGFGRPMMSVMFDPIVNRLRAKYGLRPVRDAIFGQHSPDLNLQLYSRHFAPRPPDWSAEKKQAGFCFYDPPGTSTLPEELENFLQSGEAPVLFTLGSTAVHQPGNFYRSAVETLRHLGLRGVLLTGSNENQPPDLPESILALPYAPYGLLMPRVRAVFHQCGIGTLSHTLRAGVPSVAHPFAFDQPNNARRLEALGAAEVLLPHERESHQMTQALERLLAGDAPATARRLGELIRAEDGVGRACELLVETFAARTGK